MNYRHAFHAGNFADVVKHIVLTRILLYLHDKPSAFRVIDSHAGAGRYDLKGVEAQRSGEWRDGIAKLLAAQLPPEAAELVAPYLDIVRAFNGAATKDGELVAYPGSPLIARALLRPQDRLVACETEENARKTLIRALRKDEQARVVDLDGWTALGAFVPPQERRGVVLIDPPFEARDEFDRLAAGFATAYERWPTGIYVLWYPAKDRRDADGLARTVGRLAADVLRLEVSVAPRLAGGPLAAAGLLVINAPWTLPRDLRALMPSVAGALGRTGRGDFRLEHTGK
jgi:23S rRNA (adenine2030-N6)-methyltransferase